MVAEHADGYPAPIGGDGDLMLALIKFYNNSLEYSKLMTRTKFQHAGAYWQEAGPIFGSSFQGTNCASAWCAGPKHNELARGGSYGSYGSYKL